MHLLKDVLPASASCASALEAAVDAAITNSVPKVSFFMGCSSSLPVECRRLCHGWVALNKPPEGGRFHDAGSVFPAIFRHVHPLLRPPTQSTPDVLDLPSQ